MDKRLEPLKQAAKEAAANAYAPYSGFKVGAAVATAQGKIFKGANVENASYGATVCAERTALFSAASSGERDFPALAVYNAKTLPMPCGMCLQVISELAPDIKILVFSDNEQKETTLKELLPNPFRMV